MPARSRHIEAVFSCHYQNWKRQAGIAVGVDGEFGPGTDKAVKEFQAKKVLTGSNSGA